MTVSVSPFNVSWFRDLVTLTYKGTRVQLVLVHFVCHKPQFKMLVFAFQSEIWIAQNFNFTVFEDFCFSLSWKYRFLQNANQLKR